MAIKLGRYGTGIENVLPDAITRLTSGYVLKEKLTQIFEEENTGFSKLLFNQKTGDIKVYPSPNNSWIPPKNFLSNNSKYAFVITMKPEIISTIYFEEEMDISDYSKKYSTMFERESYDFYEMVEKFMENICKNNQYPENIFNNGECVVCLAKTDDLRIVVPCGHQCICGDCIDYATIRHCPICRNPCSTYLKEPNKPEFSILEKGEVLINILSPVGFEHNPEIPFPVDQGRLYSSEDSPSTEFFD